MNCLLFWIIFYLFYFVTWLICHFLCTYKYYWCKGQCDKCHNWQCKFFKYEVKSNE